MTITKDISGQDAILHLKNHLVNSNYRNYIIEELKKLKKIEQIVEDCVSREAVINEIKSMSNANPSYWNHCDVIDREDLIDSIKDLPPVTLARKKGEWCKQNDDYFDWYECSEYGYGSEGEMQYSSECDVRTKYCPNCGADMRGSEID